MDAKRQADELASRCVALIIFHEHVIETRPKGHPIASEIRAIGLEARNCGISDAVIVAKVLDELRVDSTRRRPDGFTASSSSTLASISIPPCYRSDDLSS